MSIDEVERYQKILEDWSLGSGKEKAAGPPAAARPAQPGAAPAASAPGAYQNGAILCLDGRTIAIYKQRVPEKEYHLMLVLFPNQRVKTQGIAMEGYHVEEIGCLPPEMLERLQQQMRWTRDMIVFHCYSYDDVERIPQQLVPPTAAATPEDPNGERPVKPERPVAEPTAAAKPAPAAASAAPATNGVLRRGQRLKVKFGDKAWYAVYWGSDDQGQVVAHQTNKTWSLMHLDLVRFADDLAVDPNIDVEVVEEIEAALGSQ